MSTLNQEFAFATIDEVAELLKSRQLSPVELTMDALNRIEQLNPKLNAFITITNETALAQARQAEQDIMNGRYRGALHGIPIVHKDIYYTKGVRTTVCSKILENHIPDYDATAVSQLSDAGTIMLGKVQTHEFAAGAMTNSPHFKPCHNPWDLEKSPGGSSGGSGSAVAAGLAFMGTGTDTGGSIRIPAAACGIVGMKPTYGRVSRHGIFPLAWSLDHGGPLTRTVKDAALCLQAMAGYDPKDEASVNIPVPDFTGKLRLDLKGVKIGVPTPYYYDNIDGEIDSALKKALDDLRRLGAEIIEVNIPLLKDVHAISMGICLGEVASIHDEWYRKHPELYGPDVLGMIEAGRLSSAVQYLQAQRARKLLQREFLDAFESVDVLVTPTLPITAPLITNAAVGMRLAELTMPTNVTGLPSLALPCGFDSNNMPISMQIIGKPFAEDEVLGIGHAYELSTEWHKQHPVL
ncbi:amidase [Paenibacillus sp. HB172176]|uniref:amidase n=1 Tax=Paenibacillus sp. HB172176 TaxID=2493690 RepID=UPI00143C2EBA|nr:amidase [Paenibacillus sp. HB172176]